jgi:hypothetical protein
LARLIVESSGFCEIGPAPTYVSAQGGSQDELVLGAGNRRRIQMPLKDHLEKLAKEYPLLPYTKACRTFLRQQSQ